MSEDLPLTVLGCDFAIAMVDEQLRDIELRRLELALEMVNLLSELDTE